MLFVIKKEGSAHTRHTYARTHNVEKENEQSQSQPCSRVPAFPFKENFLDSGKIKHKVGRGVVEKEFLLFKARNSF